MARISLRLILIQTRHLSKTLKVSSSFLPLGSMQVDDESMRAFDSMSEGQRRRLLKIHRDMATQRPSSRTRIFQKEEKEFLENRYESLFGAKAKG